MSNEGIADNCVSKKDLCHVICTTLKFLNEPVSYPLVPFSVVSGELF